MYAAAMLLAGATTAGTTGLPYFHLGSLNIGVPIQSFGVIVAAGVLIGAALLRRYAEWHGVSDEDIRGITGWITVSGFIGAHVFDVVFYQWHDLENDPILLFKVWAGISSYGGFLGGAIGFFLYTWWKRVDMRLFADIAIVGLLPAFSIGRIGCTVVSDHIGAAVDPNAWYAGLAMDYPRALNLGGLADTYPGTSETIKAWNLGLVEFLYLIPVNALILWLAFRPSKQGKDEKWLSAQNAGFVTALTGVLYAPVRFGLDYLRPETTDPRYLGLTFAQWSSVLAFTAAIAFAVKVFKTGKAAETITKTSGQAQERLRVVLKGDDDDDKDAKDSKKKTVKEEKKPAKRDESDKPAKQTEDQDDKSATKAEDKKSEKAEKAEKSEASKDDKPAEAAE